jgi:hypothetical protein
MNPNKIKAIAAVLDGGKIAVEELIEISSSCFSSSSIRNGIMKAACCYYASITMYSSKQDWSRPETNRFLIKSDKNAYQAT